MFDGWDMFYVAGDDIPVTELDEKVVEMYVKEVKMKHGEIFLPLKRQFKIQKMEILCLEDENPAAALLRYISESSVKNLVMGSCSSNWTSRRGPDIPTMVIRCPSETCDIYIVSKNKILTDLANPAPRLENRLFAREGPSGSGGPPPPRHHRCQSTAATSISEDSFLADNISTYSDSSVHGVLDPEQISTTELEHLRLELQNTVMMYRRTCEELVHSQNKIQLLSSECLDEARKVNAAMEREGTLRKLAAQEKEKYLQTLKEIDEAKKSLAKESYEKQMAELNALKESVEKQKLDDNVLMNDRRYRRYTKDDIKAATDFFSKRNVIGEGGYGKVYKCSLDRTPVAVKILQLGAVDRKEEFLREERIYMFRRIFKFTVSYAF